MANRTPPSDLKAPPRCEFCDLKFESEEKLLEHIRRNHGDKLKLVKLENPTKNTKKLP